MNWKKILIGVAIMGSVSFPSFASGLSETLSVVKDIHEIYTLYPGVSTEYAISTFSNLPDWHEVDVNKKMCREFTRTLKDGTV